MNHTTTLWGVVDLVFRGPDTGNPFTEVQLSAEVSIGARLLRIAGFYDGDGRYLVRFMPDQIGVWTYRMTSNVLATEEGSIEVGKAEAWAHGPVRAVDGHFCYADGTAHVPIGTTVYALAHQSDALVEQTLQSLSKSPFNKVRLCVFPKHFKYNGNEPPLFPYSVMQQGRSPGDGATGEDFGWRFDFDRFDPAFFRRFERLIARLGEIGIEADVILFHPYDRWGFSRMAPEQDDRYLAYIVTRLSAFPNIWWSLANEFDLLPAKFDSDWNRFLEVIAAADPYGHLRSVHNCFRFFDHAHPLVTHVSVQRDNTAQTVVWGARYGKPVIVDECGYEGDLSDIWGNLSGREMLHRIWEATIAGGYATHGETFRHPDDLVFWSRGGLLRGESVPRIGFLARLLKEAGGPLSPQPSVQRLILEVGGPENLEMPHVHAAGVDENAPDRTRMVLPWFHTLGRPHRVYLTYFGSHQPSEVVAAIPHGEVYEATLVDTWEMTQTAVAPRVSRGDVVEIPTKSHQALMFRRVHPDKETL